MAAVKTCAVLHVALNPLTGPWSVMRELAAAQASSGLYAGVGIGVIHDRSWPEAYRAELRDRDGPCFRQGTVKLFGTASFLWQAVRRPGIERWVAGLAEKTGARRIVVHCHNAWMTGAFLPLRPAAGCEAVCVTTFHGVNARLDGKPLRRAAHRWMARRLCRSAARLTSVDAANIELAGSLFNLPAKRFTVVPNGVPATDRAGCPHLRGENTFTVGHVGSLSERKGWRLAAEAVRLAAGRGRPVRLVLAGEGEDRDAARELARQNPDRVEYRGFVRNPRLNLMPELDLLSVLSAHEGLPMTLIEAMSAGVPAAATAVGGIPEAISHGHNGFLIERSPRALAALVTELCEHPQKLAAASRAARKRFAEQFDIRHIVHTYHNLYTQ